MKTKYLRAEDDMFERSGIVPLGVASIILCGSSCVADESPPRHPQLAIEWVRTSAEYEALSRQAYRAAGDFLEQALADESFSALPGQGDAADLPPAIIIDVDETVLTNVEFQAILEPPFRNEKLDNWSTATVAVAVPGAVEFVDRVTEAGVELFFLTNRPCNEKPGVADPCPQHAVTVDDLNEAGIPADAERVMLANERPEWNREKSVRRNLIAETHRVIMLVGDDLGDFIPCTRKRPQSPCTVGATIASRRELTQEFGAYWGAGWFILPNPMHGSWTTVE